MTDKTDPRLDVLLPIFDRRVYFTRTVLGSIDAADRAAGIVRVDTNDEALVERLAAICGRAAANEVLAALREAS